MRLLAPFFLALYFTGCHLQKDCPGHGWSSAKTICYRLVHFPESFWAARTWCETVRGNLLSLHNVKEVMDALGDTMEGNAGEYRIDGWAEGTWFHKENETLEHDDYELLGALTGKTLTVDLQDGQVHSNAEEGTRMGFICEGSGDLTCGDQPLSGGASSVDASQPRPQKSTHSTTNLADHDSALVIVQFKTMTSNNDVPASLSVTERGSGGRDEKCSGNSWDFCDFSSKPYTYVDGDEVTMTLKLHKAAEGVEGHAGVKLTMLKEMEPYSVSIAFMFPGDTKPLHKLTNKQAFGGDTNSNDAKMHMNAFCINMETWEVVENDALLSFQDYSYDVDLMDKWCE